MFVYKSTLNKLELKEDKGTEYVNGWKLKWIYANGWKLKWVYTSKLTPLYTAFLHNIKLFWHRIRIQFDKSILVA